MAKKIWDRLTPIERDAIAQGGKLLEELRARVNPDWREKSGEDRHRLVTGMRLRELRESRQISQEELAARLGRTQSAVSQIEKRGDLLLSTLTHYVEAADGKLINFTVHFPEGEVHVVPFETLG